MKANELTKQCLYYHGEDICPYNDANKQYYWGIERAWAIDTAKSVNKGSITPVQDEILSIYISAGLSQFEMTDDTPITLKALLFFKLKDAQITPEQFKDIYVNQYKKEAK